MTARQLRRRESRLLAVESPSALGHVSTVTILDATRASHAIDGSVLHAEVEARLDDLPLLRQSLVEIPLGVDRPWWRDDPGFDLDYHLRYISVPDPDDPESLAQLVARIHSRPLDRQRPLWELYLISGLADGRKALLSKVHLAALGSAGGDELTAGLVGASPELRAEPDAASPRWRPEPGPSIPQMAATAWWNASTDPVRSLLTIPRRLTTIPGVRAVLNPGLALLSQRTQRSIVVPGETMTPRTSFNRRVGSHRRWAAVVIELDRIAAIRQRHGVSTVDVLSTICAGALRWWLLEHDELPRESLQALVPLSVSAPDAVDGIAGALISLQTHRHRPLDRLGAIHDEIGEAVERHGALPAAEISVIGGGTPLLGTIASRLLERSPLSDRLQPPFNTIITSIPGPADTRYALGAPVEAIHPILGVVDGVGLHIGAMSVGDRLCVSLVADRDLIPDLSALAERVATELDILERASTSPAASAG